MKLLTGDRLTAGNQKAIESIMNAGLTNGCVRGVNYIITKSEENVYEVIIYMMKKIDGVPRKTRTVNTFSL